MSGVRTNAIRAIKHLIAGLGLGLVTLSGLAQAETVVSVSQVSYNVNDQPICTAVRMNPATFGALPADACTQATIGTYGPDRITQNIYDAAGQMLAVYRGVGTSSLIQYATYSYTNNGLKQSERDANGNTTLFSYDGFDRVQRAAYPTTVVGTGSVNNDDYEWFNYDANGNRTSWRRRTGQWINYSFDNLNREVMKDLPAYAGSTATSKDIYTGYDGLGHILYKRFASASGAGVSYTYDGLGRVSATTDMNGRTLTYAYNEASQRVALGFPDGIGQYYAYYNNGAMIYTAIWGGSVAHFFAYDNIGRVTAIGRQNGANSLFAYDAIGRLTSMAHDFNGTAFDITWSFNGYNPAGQITNWNASSTVYDYVETTTAAENRTYDGLNRDASIAAVSGGYDTAGNMANDGSRIFTYDVENRLLTGAGTLVGLNLEYDPEGRLYRYSYNGTQTSFLYDGNNLIGEYDSSGNMQKRYMHTLGTDQPWVQFAGAAVSAANATYLYANYQGSIIAMADMNGNAIDLYKYGPYGEPRNYGNGESWSGNRFRYTGQIMLGDAKLYYYKARVYDPAFGRFLQTDPVGSKDDLDLYAYVGGDPINATDPTGMESLPGGSQGNGSSGGGSDFCGITGCLGDPGNSFSTRPTSSGSSAWGGDTTGDGASIVDTQSRGATRGLGGILGFPEIPSADALDQAANAGAQLALKEDYEKNPNNWVLVIRWYGGASREDGRSWTNAAQGLSTANPRNTFGIPNVNTMKYYAVGAINRAAFGNPSYLIQRPALPLDGYKGGGPEILITAPNVRSVVIIYSTDNIWHGPH